MASYSGEKVQEEHLYFQVNYMKIGKNTWK